jgi:two-component system CheB/CheR fusion protein
VERRVCLWEGAYTLAMILAEILGPEAFRQRVKIYATDIDEEALAQARLASYRPEGIQPVPEEWCEKYFVKQNGRFVFNGDLRRSVIFGRHDLVQDAPISRLDLLVCRNTLMYFNAETQGNILIRFHFALNDYGFLYLGKAEMLLTHTNLFILLDLKHRLFSKVPKVEMHDRLFALAQTGDDVVSNRPGRQLRLRDLAFDISPEAHLVVDINGVLLMANEKSRTIFSLATSDIGRSIQDLEICYWPLDLRPLIDQVTIDHKAINVTHVERKQNDSSYSYVDVSVLPLADNDGHLFGVNIVFTDINCNKRLETQLQNSKAELETAFQELQSTNEELETANKELQSTVEELETTNEELQSTSEELETMNDEMRQRTGELSDANAFLKTILGNLSLAVVVVDREFCVLTWNHRAEDLWGLHSDEVVGQSFLGLEIGLPVEQMKMPIRAILEEKENGCEINLPAVIRRGKTIQCRVTFSTFTILGKTRQDVVLLMDETNDK